MGISHSRDAVDRPGDVGPFARLARVEAQEVMRWLDAISLLRLARCSKRLYLDSDCDFVWQTQPPFTIRLPSFGAAVRPRRAGLGSLFSRSRSTTPTPTRAPVPHWRIGTIRVDTAAGGLVKDDDIDALFSLPRVDELVDGVQTRLASDQWRRVLHAPAMAHLAVLTIGMDAPHDIVSHLVHLPRLHTLRLSVIVSESSLDTSSLASLPALTEIGVTDLESDSDPTILSDIAACTHLTHLSLVEATFSAGEFERFLTSPNLAQLERLRLCCCYVEATAEGYRAAFEALDGLRYLEIMYRLSMHPHPLELLAGAAHAPHLLQLDLTATREMHQATPLSHPSDLARALGTLMAAHSDLHVALRLEDGLVDEVDLAALDSHRLTVRPRTRRT